MTPKLNTRGRATTLERSRSSRRPLRCSRGCLYIYTHSDRDSLHWVELPQAKTIIGWLSLTQSVNLFSSASFLRPRLILGSFFFDKFKSGGLDKKRVAWLVCEFRVELCCRSFQWIDLIYLRIFRCFCLLLNSRAQTPDQWKDLVLLTPDLLANICWPFIPIIFCLCHAKKCHCFTLCYAVRSTPGVCHDRGELTTLWILNFRRFARINNIMVICSSANTHYRFR